MAEVHPETVAEVREAIQLPVLTLPDGRTFTATRYPRVADALAFMEAWVVEHPTAQSAIGLVRLARTQLVGMGFPAEVVDDLRPLEVIHRARDFFLAELGYHFVGPSAADPDPTSRTPPAS